MKAIILLLICIALSNAQSRYENIKTKAEKTGVVQFDSQAFQNYVSNKHNYSLVVLFSTMDEGLLQQCEPCHPINDAFKTIASHYVSTLGPQKFESETFKSYPIFFAYCDIVKCRDLVMQRQWRELPKLIYLPPLNVKKNEVEMAEFSGLLADPSLESMSKFIFDRTQYKPILMEPSQASQIGVYVAALLGLYILVVHLAPSLYQHAKTPTFWFYLSIAVYGFSMSGPVFNAINKPPFSYRHPQNGQVFYIYPSARQQFVAEGLIMGAICMLYIKYLLILKVTCCAVLIVGISGFVPNVKGGVRQRLAFFTLSVALFFSVSTLLRIFKAKYNYYPFA